MATEIPLRLQFDDTCIKCKTFLPKGTNFYRNSEGQTNCVECYQSVDDEILSEQDLSKQNFSNTWYLLSGLGSVIRWLPRIDCKAFNRSSYFIPKDLKTELAFL